MRQQADQYFFRKESAVHLFAESRFLFPCFFTVPFLRVRFGEAQSAGAQSAYCSSCLPSMEAADCDSFVSTSPTVALESAASIMTAPMGSP